MDNAVAAADSLPVDSTELEKLLTAILKTARSRKI